MNEHMPARSLKVAYLLQRFPRLSETFILREMSWIRRYGVELCIFPLLAAPEQTAQSHGHDVCASVRYASSISWLVLKAQVHFLRQRPRQYARAFVNMLMLTYREPKLFLISLALFPKCVYYARQMEVLAIEHIHSHFAWSAAVGARIASDLTGIAFTIHTHAFDLFTANMQGLRARLRGASRIVTVSRFNFDYIRLLLPDANVEIVHCGIEPERFTPGHRCRNGFTKILSVGRLIEKKGHAYLIDACALLAERGLKFHCLIVGTGPLFKTLHNRITRYNLRDRVQLLGALKEDKVLQLNRDSDIFALACMVSADGDRDGLPVSIMEAMACGLPVVSTKVTAIGELVEDGGNGMLVSQRDAVALADALQVLIENESLRLSMGTRARGRVLQDFTIQANTARLAQIFHQIASGEQGCSSVPYPRPRSATELGQLGRFS